MEPATAILIGSLISAAIAGGTTGYQSYKTDQYQKKQKKWAEEEQKKQELQQRRQALAKAIGAGDDASFLSMPKKQLAGPQAPNFTASNIASGVGQAAAQGLTNYYGSRMQPKASTGSSVPVRRYDYSSAV